MESLKQDQRPKNVDCTSEPRAQICEATRELLRGGRAFEAISTDELVKSAGVSRNDFDNEFESRDALLRTLYEHVLQEYLASDGDPVNYSSTAFKGVSPREAIARHVQTLATLYRDETELMRTLHAAWILDESGARVTPSGGEFETAYYTSLSRFLRKFSRVQRHVPESRMFWLLMDAVPTLLLSRFDGGGKFEHLEFDDDDDFLGCIIDLFFKDSRPPLGRLELSTFA